MRQHDKQLTVTKDVALAYKRNDCEVLLAVKDCSSQSGKEKLNQKHAVFYIPGDFSKMQKLLKKKVVADYICQLLLKSDQASPALKSKRIIHAAARQVYVDGTPHNIALYVVPILVRQDIDLLLQSVALSEKKLRFVLLHKALVDVTQGENPYPSETKQLVELVSQWYKKQFLRPSALTALFRPSALERIQENVTNPAYAAEQNQGWFLLENNLTPEDVMEKMKNLDKCDYVVYNALYGTDSAPYNQVEMLVTNPFFRQAEPSYENIKVPDREEWFKGDQPAEELGELSWVEEFPLHRAAADGDIPSLQQHLQTDSSRVEAWDHEGWAPVHYACWYGRVETVKVLLEEWNCDPNLCNKNKTSLLHLAAGCGHVQIVKLLCDHPFIDRHAKDKQVRSVIECCEQIRSKDWVKCVQSLKELNHKPYQKLTVLKMDGSEKVLELKHGSNTRAKDVLDNLHLPAISKQYFALWITSSSLHLQLKQEHSLLREILKWPEILISLSGVSLEACVKEKPRIVLKRDALLLPNIEEGVTDIMSIRLLYEEAVAQVLRGLYPSTEEVTLAMASIVMRILHGPYDSKRHKLSFVSDDVASHVIPGNIRTRAYGWVHKLLTQYKEISEQGPGEISELQLLYLRYCWTQIPAYGSAFFYGYAYATRNLGAERIQRIVPLYIGVNHRGIHFIKVENKALLVSLSYHSLEWKLNDKENLFHLCTVDQKINMVIHTPQAALVCSLMEKLCNAAC